MVGNRRLGATYQQRPETVVAEESSCLNPGGGVELRKPLQERLDGNNVRRVAAGPLGHLHIGQLPSQLVDSPVKDGRRPGTLHQQDRGCEPGQTPTVPLVLLDGGVRPQRLPVAHPRRPLGQLPGVAARRDQS